MLTELRKMRMILFLVLLVPSLPLSFHPAPRLTRRSLIASIVAAPAVATSPLPSFADEAAFPATQSTLASLKSTATDGLNLLTRYINNDPPSSEQLLDFTRNWDLEFRKAKMVKCKKVLVMELKEDGRMSEDETKSLFEKLTSLSNAVTFDLIAVNKVSERSERLNNVAQARFVSNSTSRAPFVVELYHLSLTFICFARRIFCHGTTRYALGAALQNSYTRNNTK